MIRLESKVSRRHLVVGKRGGWGVLLAALALHWEKDLLGIMVRREED